jgi:hypothetical protein
MERKFMASFYFNNGSDENSVEYFVKICLELLIFPPSVMTVHVSPDEVYNEISFDKNELFAYLNEKPLSVRIMNKKYDEDGANYWFLVKEEGNNIISVQWSIADLDFLLTNESLNFLIGDKDFICGYCYDQFDSAMQSITDLEYFKAKLPTELYKTVKNNFNEDIIDVSEHWGRNVFTAGLNFIAAPLMWFGNNYFSIISKNKLLQFPYASLLKRPSFEVVCIKLFEIDQVASLPINRFKQKEFWDFFDFSSIIEKYEMENEIDPVQSLKDFLFKIKRGKK